MANTTKRAPIGHTPFGNTGQYYGASATNQIFWPNALVGLLTTGDADKFDDAASKCFVGVMSEINKEVPSGGSAGETKLDLRQPRFVEIAIDSSVTVADIGETVYIKDDQTCSLSPGVFGNVLGTIHAIVSSTVVSVEVAYGGERANIITGASRAMAATGAQTLTKWDIGKTIFVPNTAALTLSLPPIAQTQAGDRLTIVKTTADAFAVTLDPNASELIDGSSTLATIDAAFDAATIVSTGTAWVVLNRDIA